MNEKQRKILTEARAHDGRYLLPRSIYDTDDAEKWDACRALVDGGYARWMGLANNLSPGIILTGKPEDTP